MKKSVSKKQPTLRELSEQIAFIIKHMATKDDIRNMATKDDIADIKEELRDIKVRLKDLEDMVENHAGHSREIDHALDRIAVIERKLGIKHR